MKATLFQKLIAGAMLCLAAPLAVTAQSSPVDVLFSFTNSEVDPIANLVQGPDGNFYGTGKNGGSGQHGSVFRVSPNGSWTTLVEFNGTNGRDIWAPLTLGSGGIFYGSAFQGGTNNQGTVFSVTTNGTLNVLVNFNTTNGAGPIGAMIFGPDGNLYGTTRNGGSNGFGTVFKMTTNGTLTTLVSFNNANGARPQSGLTRAENGDFYGTTYYGGSKDDGTVFKMTPTGKLTTLVSFAGTNGANPWGGLTLGKFGSLYGTTYTGGNSGDAGTVFTLSPDGELRTLFFFNRLNGEGPAATLAYGDDGNLYGTTIDGGASQADGDGTLFKMTPGGVMTTLFHFTESSGKRPNGAFPYAGLTLASDGSFYGTTYSGVGFNSGTVFRLNLPPGISSQPISRFKAVGTTASFTVGAFGSQPLSYQWFKNGTNEVNGTNVSGANSNTLTLSHLRTIDAGIYTVVVTNNWGSVTSHVAVLIVLRDRQSAVSDLQMTASAPDAGAQLLDSLVSGNQLSFEGTPGLQYVVQYATNLTDGPWIVLSTNTPDANGSWIVIDPASDVQRYYRAVAP